MQHRKKGVRYPEKKIRSFLRLQQTKDITVAEFCQSHKISRATFYNWRSKYSLSIHKQPAREKQDGFIPVSFVDQVGQADLFAEIELSSNVRVKLFQKVDASYFKALLS